MCRHAHITDFIRVDSSVRDDRVHCSDSKAIAHVKEPRIPQPDCKQDGDHLDKKEDGIVVFKYAHSRAYQDVQRQFLECVRSMGKLVNVDDVCYFTILLIVYQTLNA